MKKLFFSLLVVVAVTGVHAQVTNEPNPMAHTPATQPENNAYWYYPSQNVYYNEASKNYWYYNEATTKWASGQQLANPYTPVSDKDSKYQIRGGQDIWKLNADHKTKYHVQKTGTTKKKMTSSNKMKPSHKMKSSNKMKPSGN